MTMTAGSPSATPTSRMNLKRRLRRVVAATCAWTGVAALWHLLVARRGVRILAYHGVETPPSTAYAVAVELFDAQMRHLKECYRVISLDAYRAIQERGERAPSGSVVLTFDDGYIDFARNAVPILEKYGLPATCFVITSKVDDADARFMKVADLKGFARTDLITVGSHSRTHRSIAELDAAGQLAEIQGSKIELESILARDVAYFCYPYGTFNDFDDRTTQVVAKAGYAMAFSIVNGINLPGANPLRLSRTKIEWGDDPKTFARIMRGAMDIWFFADFFLRFAQRRRFFRLS